MGCINVLLEYTVAAIGFLKWTLFRAYRRTPNFHDFSKMLSIINNPFKSSSKTNGVRYIKRPAPKVSIIEVLKISPRCKGELLCSSDATICKSHFSHSLCKRINLCLLLASTPQDIHYFKTLLLSLFRHQRRSKLRRKHSTQVVRSYQRLQEGSHSCHRYPPTTCLLPVPV